MALQIGGILVSSQFSWSAPPSEREGIKRAWRRNLPLHISYALYPLSGTEKVENSNFNHHGKKYHFGGHEVFMCFLGFEEGETSPHKLGIGLKIQILPKYSIRFEGVLYQIKFIM